MDFFNSTVTQNLRDPSIQSHILTVVVVATMSSVDMRLRMAGPFNI